MNKKIIIAIIVILLLITGFFAVTQEFPFQTDNFSGNGEEFPGEDFEYSDDFSPDKPPKIVPNWIRPVRWFRSNRGGMAIQEIPSRFAALRNEYALAILFAEEDILPDYLLPFYNDEFYVEIRTLYEKGEQIRTQWIFRDINATVRLIAVFNESEEISEGYEFPAEEAEEIVMEMTDEELLIAEEEMTELTELTLSTELDLSEELALSEEEYENFADYYEEQILIGLRNNSHENINIPGFIEIYDEGAHLIAEYRYGDDGNKTKTEFNFKDKLLMSALVLQWQNDERGGSFVEFYEDFYRYNRSFYLRGIERKFYKDGVISFAQEPTIISFPLRIMDAEQINYFIGDRLNPYPEFFGDFQIQKNNKIIYTADERGRIMTQIMYDEEEEIVWIVQNIWSNERIIKTSKKEGEIELLAEYEYNADGDRIVERNIRNGKLERIVRSEGKIDIEELYIDNVIVLRAVWDDGRKISETRIGRQ